MSNDYLKEKLIKCKGVSFDEVNIDELDDITKIIVLSLHLKSS